MTEAHLVARGGHGLCAPHFDGDGTLWLASMQTGEILRLVRDGDALALAVAFSAGIHPCALAVQPADGTIFLADLGHKSVLAVSPQGQTSEFVREYEQIPFLGPSAIAFDGKRNLYLCDAGPVGETGLHAPKGSVFVVSSEGQLLLPVTLESLAYPSAIALAPAIPAESLDGTGAGAAVETVQPLHAAPYLYVAEMAANRILRFARRPVDVFIGAVFHQFAGGAGPSALACAPDGSLFVAHFEYALSANTGTADTGSGARAGRTDAAATAAAAGAVPGGARHGQRGRISRLAPTGELIDTLYVPAPELTGLALKGRTLYVTEGSTNSLFAIEL
ncbi:hypothetical protein KFE25_004425 [Diacronema lutheri]|uniref:SMP-30/Gluconolactonase/LRE-like region domain-containing protein n=2 Tax=Diacronema lutheri TaxID=2081491 RepID=A0A8J6C2V2_DIALT|nr:hypothetical protein KFE25_004425 [Diacronema lutheri]